MCGRAVTNTSNSGSGGPGFKPRSSRCFLGQGTLLSFVSLHPGVPATPISFCKRSLPFLTVDATIANEAFSSDRWIKLHKANNTFLNSARKNDVEAGHVEFSVKVMERAGVTCY